MSGKVYQLKITIKDIKPPIWRRLLVQENITFYKFHKIIQAAFGWQDYHLFNFHFGDAVICLPDPYYGPDEMYGPGVEELNAKRNKIDDWLDERKEFVYTYDFGDNWNHQIIVEDKIEADKGVKYPVCTAGERHRPPEDVGGIPGYADFLQTIADPNNPESEDMLVWAEKDTGGRKFDPEYFYLNEINRALTKIK